MNRSVSSYAGSSRRGSYFLPPSYSTFLTALEARDTVSLGYVQQSLIHDEQWLNTDKDQKSTDAGGATG